MSCTLCDLPTPDPPVTEPGVEGSYCCEGCLTVARTLPAAADETDLDRGADDAAGEPVYLRVGGMHCATCEAFLESRATDLEGVVAADASYPADAMRVVLDPAATRGLGTDAEGTDGQATVADGRPTGVDAVAEAVAGLGYDVEPVGAGHGEAGTAGAPGGTDDDVDTGRLLVGGFFGMMAMAYYAVVLYPAYLGYDLGLVDLAGPAGTYLLWNTWLFATVVVGYTGWPVLRGAYVSLRAGHPNMDLLVGLAASTAYVYSTAVLATGGTEVYFDVAVVVVLAVTVGNYYEARVKRAATGRLADLTAQRVDRARRRTGGDTETVSVGDLQPGDELVVREGERVPVDGTVVEGTGAVDEALVTGESVPVRRTPGDEALGGTVVREGGLVVAVGPAGESTLDRLVGLLWDVTSRRAGVARLVDRFAAGFVPLVVLLAVATAAWHLTAGGVGPALLAGLAVLVVSCPCALGLATPLAVAGGVRSALDRGVVVADGSLFERAPAVDVVALDKTGTLSTGEMAVREVVGDGEVLARAAEVERFSAHPLADAVVDAARDDGQVPEQREVAAFETHPGRGVAARVDGTRVHVGRADLLAEAGLEVPPDLADRAERARAEGAIPALVGWDGRARGLIVAGDRPRPGWRRAVDRLAAGREVVVLSGDSEAATEPFGGHPAVAETFAGVPPEGKVAVVRRLRERGTVAMVGDGSNDAPALAAADVGVALADGTALAGDAADAVVLDDDLGAVADLFDVTAATNRRVRENLGWALLYNATAIPLAVAGLLSPALAAVAMAASSLLVVGNSARELGGETGDDPTRPPDDPARPPEDDAGSPATPPAGGVEG